jgi:hypothetical protein
MHGVRFSIWQLFLSVAVVALAVGFPQQSTMVMLLGSLMLLLVRPSLGCGFALGVWWSLVVVVAGKNWLDLQCESAPAEAYRSWQIGSFVMLVCGVAGGLVSRSAVDNWSPSLPRNVSEREV